MSNRLALDELDVSIHPMTGDVAPELASALIVTIVVVIFV